MSLRLLAVFTVAMLLVMPAMAQSSLKIPRDMRDMQEIIRESDRACSGCGVVTNVANVEAGNCKNPPETGNSRSGNPGPGTDILTTWSLAHYRPTR